MVNRHTNVAEVLVDGVDVTANYRILDTTEEAMHADRQSLNVKDIVEYADTVDLAPLIPILTRQMEMNMAIAEEGLKGEWGASIGKLLLGDGNCSLSVKARAYAAAGSDARMSGCELPVCIISGSGNQGMTASIPVVIYARSLGVDDETSLFSFNAFLIAFADG